MVKKINNKAYFEDIYVQYYSKLKRFAKKYVLFEEDAENIVHDVFTMLWENCDTFSLHSNIFAFLFLSTKNKCINHLRRKAVEKDVKNNLSDEIISTLGLNYISLEAFDKNLFSEDDIESIIHKALDTLPEKCRRIFIMNKLEGKKQKDIAKELNLSVNTVESQMAIAYKKLRSELKNLLPLLLFLLS